MDWGWGRTLEIEVTNCTLILDAEIHLDTIYHYRMIDFNQKVVKKILKNCRLFERWKVCWPKIHLVGLPSIPLRGQAIPPSPQSQNGSKECRQEWQGCPREKGRGCLQWGSCSPPRFPTRWWEASLVLPQVHFPRSSPQFQVQVSVVMNDGLIGTLECAHFGILTRIDRKASPWQQLQYHPYYLSQIPDLGNEWVRKNTLCLLTPPLRVPLGKCMQ